MKKWPKYNKLNNSVNWQRLKEYFSNGLSEKENNEVERYLLSDPFNSDAADGLESNAPASLDNDINNIKKRIERKTGYYPIKPKVQFSINYRIAAAASIIIVAGLAIIYFAHNANKLQNLEVAQNTKLQEKDVTTKEFISDHEDITEVIEIDDNEIIAINNSEKDKNAKLAPQKEQVLIEPTKKEENLKIERITLTEKIDKKLATDVIESEINTAILVEDEQDILRETTISDTDQIFTAVETMATTTAAKVSIDTKELTFKHKQSDSIGSNQESAHQQRVQQSAVAAMPPIPNNQYIESIKNIITERYNNIEGVFEVWFNVEVDGSLTEFDVTKSISRRSDRRILKEIENAGKWKPAYLNSKPVQSRSTIIINFNK